MQLLQKLLPAVFIFQRDKQLVAVLGPTGYCVLLPHLLVPLDTLVRAVNTHDTAHWHVFRWRQCGKEETSEYTPD